MAYWSMRFRRICRSTARCLKKARHIQPKERSLRIAVALNPPSQSRASLMTQASYGLQRCYAEHLVTARTSSTPIRVNDTRALDAAHARLNRCQQMIAMVEREHRAQGALLQATSWSKCTFERPLPAESRHPCQAKPLVLSHPERLRMRTLCFASGTAAASHSARASVASPALYEMGARPSQAASWVARSGMKVRTLDACA